MKSVTPMIFSCVILALVSSCNPTAVPEVAAPTRETPEKTPAPEKPATPKSTSATVSKIEADQLFSLREDGKALIYDVRLPVRYHLGHIEGAILFYPKPFDETFTREKPKMKKAIGEGKTVILYCGGADCKDSHIVGKMIADRGIPVSVFPGGWSEWKEIGIE